jgi:exodeoxyribonuclease VII small subunit
MGTEDRERQRVPDPAEPLDFEAALGRLDELVEVLEQGRISLEEALQLYEEGVLMADRCQRLLDQAQVRLQRLSVNNADPDAGPEQAFVLETFRLDEDI